MFHTKYSIIPQVFSRAHRKIIPESYQSKPNLDCNYTFTIDLEPNRIPFGAESLGKM